MKLKLHISPCPNDTFMFDALVNGRIDTEGLRFEVSFADIEQLNETARTERVDVSKVSYAVVPQLVERYRILDSGSALGRGNGPLLVSRGEIDTGDGSLRVAVPGAYTTAFLLLKRLFPALAGRAENRLFSEIAAAVARGEYDAGVLIHEGRFTYREHGLRLVADLGLEWERATELPLPLGAIAVSSGLPEALQRQIGRLVRASIEYAFAHPEASAGFVRAHAQELDPQVTRQHIELFVNSFSLTLGDEGRRAVRELTGVDDPEIFVP